MAGEARSDIEFLDFINVVGMKNSTITILIVEKERSIFPLPLQGHIKPLICLSELLCHAGLHVTFVNTHHSHKLMANLHALATHFPTLHFDSISDGLPEDDPREVTNAFLMALKTSIKPHFRDLLHSYLSSIKLADDGRRLPWRRTWGCPYLVITLLMLATYGLVFVFPNLLNKAR